MKRRNTHTSYERYLSVIEQDTETPQYVVDCEGNLHDLSGNIQIKLESVDKTRRYWEVILRNDSDNDVAERFYNKFTKLYEQIQIFIENTDLVAHS